MAKGMQIGRAYVLRDGKMLPVSRGVMKMPPAFPQKGEESPSSPSQKSQKEEGPSSSGKPDKAGKDS